MTDETYLDILPTELLLIIFGYCHAFDLVRLSEVCRRFNDIVVDDFLWRRRRDRPIATNQSSYKFRQRCNPVLDLRARWNVSYNWERGKCNRKIFHSWEQNTMPWIFLSNESLWWSSGDQLCAYRRQHNRPFHSFRGWNEYNRIFNREDISDDISKFIVRDQYVISGHRGGHITYWSKATESDTHLDVRIENAHASHVNAIDEVSGIIISGSNHGTVKLWSQPQETVPTLPITTINVFDRVWSLAADQDTKKVAVGSSGHNWIPPLKIFDLECCSDSFSIRHKWKRGAGIYDMLWEDSNILLTCGFDTYVRKWDTRIGKCVATWADPNRSALYCLSSDYRYTIVTGTQYKCKAVLWDQRMTRYVQSFILPNIQETSSPLYSISFDSSSLWGATDRLLIELTFSGYNYHQTNFRNRFRSRMTNINLANEFL